MLETLQRKLRNWLHEEKALHCRPHRRGPCLAEPNGRGRRAMFIARALLPEEIDEGTKLKYGVYQDYRKRREKSHICASGFLMSDSSI